MKDTETAALEILKLIDIVHLYQRKVVREILRISRWMHLFGKLSH